MSAAKTIGPFEHLTYAAFYVTETHNQFAVCHRRGCWFDPISNEVDRFRTRCAAQYAARMLNQGHAVLNPHATIGCRVEVI